MRKRPASTQGKPSPARLRAYLCRNWQPVSPPLLYTCIFAYTAFLVYAFMNSGGFLFMDHVNLVVHEAGHLLFSWFGQTLGLWGGTLLQWLVPVLLALYFLAHCHATGFAFCTFMFSENLLYSATYMADARRQTLPLVTVGDAGTARHDWATIFSSMGVLQYDTTIAAVVRLIGWIGMIGTVVWLARQRSSDPASKASS